MHREVRQDRDKDGRVPEDSETQIQHDHLTWEFSWWHDSTQPTAFLSQIGMQAGRKKGWEEALGPAPQFRKLGPEVVFLPRIRMGWEECIISSLSQEAQARQSPGHLPSANECFHSGSQLSASLTLSLSPWVLMTQVSPIDHTWQTHIQRTGSPLLRPLTSVHPHWL